MKKLFLAVVLALAPHSTCWAERWVVEPSIQDYSKPALEPGSPLNPYEIRRNSRGNLEMSTPLPAPGRALEPGSPLNPIEIKRRD